MPSTPATFVIIFAMSLFAPASAKSPEDFLGTANKPGASAPTRADSASAKSAKAKESAAPKASVPRQAMDTAKIHATYLEGDFDLAIRTLESVMKSKKALTHADSVFIFKHLGVMYAATPATREKGRFYISQLIAIEPTVKILDMYASDTIYLIFRNAQEELESKRTAKVTVVDTVPAPEPAMPATLPVAAAPAPVPSKSNTKFWVTGGAVVALGAMGILYILLDDPEPVKHNIVLAN